jgi:hypothetical protein
MTTLLQPLLTRSLWLDVLRQVVAGLVQSLDRVTDSFDVFIRILMAAAGVALSSVLLIAIYPLLPSDIQFFAVGITGLVWYLSLAQIQPGHDAALLPYMVYLAAMVPTVLTLVHIGVPGEQLPVLVERLTFTSFVVAFGMFLAIKVSITAINAVLWFFNSDWDNPELYTWEKKALTVAKANLPEQATWRMAVPLAVQSVALLAVGGVCIDAMRYPVGIFDYALVIIAATAIQLAVLTLVGLGMYFDKDIDKVQMKRVVRPSFKQRLASYEPLTPEEQTQLRRFNEWSGIFCVTATVAAGTAILLSFLLPGTGHVKAYAFLITSGVGIVIIFVGAVCLIRLRSRIEGRLKAARKLS